MHLLYSRYSIAGAPPCKDGFAGRSPKDRKIEDLKIVGIDLPRRSDRQRA